MSNDRLRKSAEQAEELLAEIVRRHIDDLLPRESFYRECNTAAEALRAALADSATVDKCTNPAGKGNCACRGEGCEYWRARVVRLRATEDGGGVLDARTVERGVEPGPAERLASSPETRPLNTSDAPPGPTKEMVTQAKVLSAALVIHRDTGRNLCWISGRAVAVHALERFRALVAYTKKEG